MCPGRHLPFWIGGIPRCVAEPFGEAPSERLPKGGALASLIERKVCFAGAAQLPARANLFFNARRSQATMPISDTTERASDPAAQAARVLETELSIDASAHTVWGILDDIAQYPSWNPLVPEIAGRTTVGQVLHLKLVQPGMPDLQLSPVITRAIGARELRWLSTLPDPSLLSGEHIFRITPQGPNRCHLSHTEVFKGSLLSEVWPGISTHGRAAYQAMNEALKLRAEALRDSRVSIHPCVDVERAVVPAAAFEGATLRCRCVDRPVEIRVDEACHHNHLCGCSQCWKPAGALFAQVAVVAQEAVTAVAEEAELAVVDSARAIRRYACKRCGTHMVGRVDDPDHHFFGLAFVHPELSDAPGWPEPAFAAFVSSLVEQGTKPVLMSAVRERLQAQGLPSHDAFSPELMDLIAWHRVKLAR